MVLLAFVAVATASRPRCLSISQKYRNFCMQGLNSADKCGVLQCDYTLASTALGCDLEFFDSKLRSRCTRTGKTTTFTEAEVPIAKEAATANKECLTQCNEVANKCTTWDCVSKCVTKSFEKFEGETCEGGETEDCETERDAAVLLLVKRQMRSLIRKW